ncbi:hypothetical protein Pelo_9146 [Pelomyxa schiedti]|nr:hypothetical protein Pelo_9146 [Pelomyxa schiedti]
MKHSRGVAGNGTRSASVLCDTRIPPPLLDVNCPRGDLPNQAVSLRLTSTKIFRFKTEELWIELPRAWRTANRIEEQQVFQAGLSACCCRPGTTEEVVCQKCKSKVLKFSTTSVHPYFQPTTGIEKYTISLKSICTSSRDHLHTALVVSINLLDCTLQSKPFNILSRCYKKGSTASIGGNIVTPLLISPCFVPPPPPPATPTPQILPEKRVNLVAKVEKVEEKPPAQNDQPPISIVVRIIQSTIPQDQTVSFMKAVHKLLSTDYPGNRGFLSVVFHRLASFPSFQTPLIKSSGSPPTETTPPDSPDTKKALQPTFWAVIASFLTVRDAVASLPFYNDFVTNVRRNPLDINLEAEGIVQPIQLVTNF